MKKFNSLKSCISLVIIYCLLLNFGSQFALSQTETMDTPTPTPTPAPTSTPASETTLPKPTTTPLNGDTTLENVKIESEIMGYRALKNASGKISLEIISKKGGATNLAILNSQWLLGIQSYWSAKYQLKLIKDGYGAVLVPLPQFLELRAVKKQPRGLVANIITKEEQSTQTLADGTKVFTQELEPLVSAMVIKDNTATLTSSENKSSDNKSFTGVATSIGSAFGLAGSVVGAFVDATALMRTDTKIIGSTFTVQESAFVSEVYQGLAKSKSYSKLLYPSEFPPNINIQESFIILKDIEDVYKEKARAEQLVSEIEEVEKVYKEATTEKDKLEARGKEIIKLLANEQKELKKNNEIWKTPKFRTAELQAKIKDSENKIAELKKEQEVELPKKVESNKNAILLMDATLTQLYQQIKLEKSPIDLVTAFIKIGDTLDKNSTQFLKRLYKLEELEQLSKGDTETKENLVTEAENIKNAKLTETEKAQLLNPLEKGRLEIFLKIANRIKGNGDLLNQEVLNEMLSEGEQLRLFYPLEEQLTLGKRLYDRRKIASVNRLKVLNKQFDKFFEDIIKVDATLGINPITTFLQTENLLKALDCNVSDGKCEKANALVLKVIDVGGSNRIKKNLLTMAITGDDISHSGGAIVEYKLYDMTGNILTSNVCTAYESYRKPKNIIKPRNQDNVICISG